MSKFVHLHMLLEPKTIASIQNFDCIYLTSFFMTKQNACIYLPILVNKHFLIAHGLSLMCYTCLTH